MGSVDKWIYTSRLNIYYVRFNSGLNGISFGEMKFVRQPGRPKVVLKPSNKEFVFGMKIICSEMLRVKTKCVVDNPAGMYKVFFGGG